MPLNLKGLVSKCDVCENKQNHQKNTITDFSYRG